MASQQITRAIQIVKSENESVSGEIKTVIKTVTKNRGAPNLADVLCSSGVKDLQILVFSIVGKTRGGKSLLLNLMIKYLESQPGTADWLRGTVSHETGFTWRGGLDSVTRGLWIWPKIYRRRTVDGTEVGILLLDNEGMFDGEATDGEMIAISGISTAISYLQMFNVKEKITSDYLENIVRHLVKGIEDMDSEQSKNIKDYKLMFVVRDWVYEEDHNFGLEGGKIYVDEDSQRGTEEHRKIWTEIRRTFNDIQCVLLPFPGSVVTKQQFTSNGQLSELDNRFLEEVKRFIENLFARENLNPPEITLTGEGVYQLLMNADGKIADENLSFLNMFTDHANFYKEEKLVAEFKNRIPAKPDLAEVKSIMNDILRKGENAFKGNSKTLYAERLKKTLEDMMNSTVIQKVHDNYKAEFVSLNFTREHHNYIWLSIVNLLNRYICGDARTRTLAKEKAVQKTAEIYYKTLSQEVFRRFKDEIRVLKELKDFAGLDYKTVKQNFLECADFKNLVGQNQVYPIWLKHEHNLKCKVAKSFVEKIEELTGAGGLKDTRKKQYQYYEAFNLLKKGGESWDIIKKSDTTLLCKKIGFAVFGLPKLQPNKTDGSRLVSTVGSSALSVITKSQASTNQQIEEVTTGYSSDQDEKIASIANHIISCSTGDEIKFSCVFVTYPGNSNEEGITKVISVPIFRIHSVKSKIEYVDTNCRVYKSWEDFLKKNTLPDIVICYPLHGSYDMQVGFNVAYSKTPSSTFTSKALKVADRAETVVSIGAGVAGVAALVSAPVLGPCAVVGAGAVGIYGMFRGATKIWDKSKHNESVKKDVTKLIFNSLTVAAMGTLKVAEGAVVVVSKIAQSAGSLNAFVGLCCFENAPNLIQLLDEICDHTSMISFYFNAPSPSEAIQEIRKALEINEKVNDCEVLEILVNDKSIEYSVDKGDVTKLEKHVSENVADLVLSLLKTVDPAVKDVIIHLTGIMNDFQSLEYLRPNDAFNKIDSKMCTLFLILQKENEALSKILLDLAVKNNCTLNSEVSEHFCSEITEQYKDHLLLTLRSLVWAMLQKVRNVNRYCNDIDHSPDSLISYDVKHHPLEEIKCKIRDREEQTKSNSKLQTQTELNSDLQSNISELKDFLKLILKFLLKNAQSNWTLMQYTKCLSLIAGDIMKQFDEELTLLKNCIQEKTTLNCNDLNLIFQKFGIKGNYGQEMLQKVLECYQFDQNRNLEIGQNTLTIVPAWNGMVDNLYCYFSNQEVKDKLVILARLGGTAGNYDENKCGTKLICLKPGDIDSFPTFFIYSVVKSKGVEHGLVWISPNGKTERKKKEGNRMRGLKKE